MQDIPAPDHPSDCFEKYFSRRIVFVISGVVFLALAIKFLDHTVDDAFISFRYAHNLVQGHGLVFNPGERVEGYTNFLLCVIRARHSWRWTL